MSGQHAAEIDRILRHQQSRLGANIALLEQRYEALPNPERFVSWNDRRNPPLAPRRIEHRDEPPVLPDLIARHTVFSALPVAGHGKPSSDGARRIGCPPLAPT